MEILEPVFRTGGSVAAEIEYENGERRDKALLFSYFTKTASCIPSEKYEISCGRY